MNSLATDQQNVLGDMDALDKIIRFSELMTQARATLPAELQGNPGDCLAICLQAAAWQMNPYAVAQKTYVIKGKLGYEAQLVNAVITRHAPIQGRPQFQWSDGWEKILGRHTTKTSQSGNPYTVPAWSPNDEQGLWCEVSATLNGETEPRVTRVLMVQAQPRQSTQWATDPKQQLAYVAIKKWARLHCPDVILGIYTPEELQQREPEKDVTPENELRARLQGKGESVTARKESSQPSARQDTDRPEGEKLTSTEKTPREDQQETTAVNEDDTHEARIRGILHKEKQVPLAEVTDKDRETLKMALDSIASCSSLEQLEQCGRDLEGAIHPELKDEAVKVYRERRAALEG